MSSFTFILELTVSSSKNLNPEIPSEHLDQQFCKYGPRVSHYVDHNCYESHGVNNYADEIVKKAITLFLEQYSLERWDLIGFNHPMLAEKYLMVFRTGPVEGDYRLGRSIPASFYISKMLLDKLAESEHIDRLRLINLLGCHPWTRSTQGLQLEHLVAWMFSAKPSAMMLKAVPIKKFIRVFTLPECVETFIERPLKESLEGLNRVASGKAVLWKPHKGYASIDFVLLTKATFTRIQVTRGRTHADEPGGFEKTREDLFTNGSKRKFTTFRHIWMSHDGTNVKALARLGKPNVRNTDFFKKLSHTHVLLT
ncbi:hypothetical protein M422DRAFT_274509 [Sphaerobolus stellatus SS14]|uniref:Unplaced genomic scaffold SPHSTscaffold_393, whole genome shotgun sequence n=1 Tax=Sphaerobolus stellatus (strain SS14) TaxID=990650 RepID=A0A0C9T6S7_SPHS4|nr:hypothetical protein M422DRAFT_274509 [Sphaerobolus stellatus SS14]